MPLVKPRAGKNLPAVLSKTLVSDWYAAVSELSVNEYDEDAENVRITAGLEEIVIEGDGGGMDIQGLKNFFRLADSVKVKEPYSPIKKRRRIGKYGIAKVLLKFLGNNFTIESVKNERLYRVESKDIEGKKILVHDETAEGRKNGTKITIRNLNFKFGEEEGDFRITDLVKRFAWDCPHVPDYHIYVNDIMVEKRDLSKGARTYEVKAVIKGHELSGRIYWGQAIRGGEGVRIYVNKRPVGDPSMFELRSVGFNLEGKTAGEINADFLGDLITLDRSDLQDDPRLDEVVREVYRILKSINEDIGQGRSKKAKEGDRRLQVTVNEAVSNAEIILCNRLGKDYQIELSEKAGSLARLEGNVIYINPNHKMFSFLKAGREVAVERSKEFLCRQFLVASAMAITDPPGKIVDSIAFETDYMLDLLNGRGNTASYYLRGQKIPPLEEIYLCEHRLYDSSEIGTALGRPSSVIRLLHISGALNGTEDHLFRKKDIVTVFRNLNNYVSCVEVADPRFSEDSDLKVRYDYQYTPSPVDRFLVSSKDYAKRLQAVNVGVNGPLHFMPEKFKSSLLELVSSGEIKLEGQ